MDNVTLNIYDLAPAQSMDETQQMSGFSRMVVGLLEPLGYGMYHTSIDVRGFRYQFGSTIGISRTNTPLCGDDTAESRRYVPESGQYRESIILGQTWCDQNQINSIIQKLRDTFSGDSYHIAHRNCNHFSETFAMALILGNELVEGEDTAVRLDKFPGWVNRLARTTSSGLRRDGLTMACDVMVEARMALECEKKVGWELTSHMKSLSTSVGSKKKELTAKQKEILAKLKNKSVK